MMSDAISGNLQALYQEAGKGTVPVHVALIMDGNGRWAKARHLGRIRGHRKGVQAIREVVRAARNLGVKIITLYAFSTENWARPKEEVDALWNLMVEFLEKETPELHEKNVRITAIGKIEGIPGPASKKLEWARTLTYENSGLILNLAINYGSRDEILEAVNHLIQKKKKEKEFQPVTAREFSETLYTASMPDPDLLIRTSGEQRISNYLLWQISYAELYFTQVLWPDFDEKEFILAVLEYQKRQRRFGGI